MKTRGKNHRLTAPAHSGLSAAALAIGLCARLAACTATSSPIKGNLTLEGKPSLENPFVLKLELRTSTAFTDVLVSFILPAEIELLNTPTEQRVDVEPGQTYEFTATARVLEDGYYRIIGRGQKDTPGGSSFPGADVLYLLVEGEDTWFSHDPPPNHWRSPNASISGSMPLQPDLIQNRLYLSGTLALNQPVTLVYEVTPLVDLQDASIAIVTSIGELHSRDPRVETSNTNLATTFQFSKHNEGGYYWSGSMKGNNTYFFYLTLEAAAGGQGGVRASVSERGVVDSVSRIIISSESELGLRLYSPALAR